MAASEVSAWGGFVCLPCACPEAPGLARSGPAGADPAEHGALQLARARHSRGFHSWAQLDAPLPFRVPAAGTSPPALRVRGGYGRRRRRERV